MDQSSKTATVERPPDCGRELKDGGACLQCERCKAGLQRLADSLMADTGFWKRIIEALMKEVLAEVTEPRKACEHCTGEIPRKALISCWKCERPVCSSCRRHPCALRGGV